MALIVTTKEGDHIELIVNGKVAKIWWKFHKTNQLRIYLEAPPEFRLNRNHKPKAETE